jgi:hypothetical protein
MVTICVSTAALAGRMQLPISCCGVADEKHRFGAKQPLSHPPSVVNQPGPVADMRFAGSSSLRLPPAHQQHPSESRLSPDLSSQDVLYSPSAPTHSRNASNPMNPSGSTARPLSPSSSAQQNEGKMSISIDFGACMDYSPEMLSL